MNLFLEKDDEIRLAIIKQFDQLKGQWHTRSELAEKLNLSPKKVASLIGSINEDFEKVYGKGIYVIDSCKGKGYILERDPATLKKLEIHYFERSISFLFIKKILFDQQKTTVKFCLENYTSLATLNRKLHRGKPILQSFNLKLNVSKGDLQGEEIRIRQFYYELFKNVYGTYKWPIENIEKKVMQKQIEYLIEQAGSELNSIDRYTIEIYLAVVIIRIRQQHYVNFKFEEFDWLSNHPLYAIIHNYINDQFKKLDSITSDLESEYLIFLFMTSMVIDRSERMVKKEIAFLKANHVHEYEKVRSLQRSLVMRYTNEKQIATDNLAYILTRIIISFEIFEHTEDDQKAKRYLEYQQDKYPNFYSFVKNVTTYQMREEIEPEKMDLLLSEIIPILKVNIPVTEYESPIRIGFFYETGTSQQYIAQNKISQQIHKKIVFESNEQELINMDVIIVDGKSYKEIKNKVGSKIPIISFDDILNDNSIEKLEYIIESIER